MSIATFKKKSVTIKGTNQSGRSPGGYWSANPVYCPEGFSLNGGTRSHSVGNTMLFSKSGTPYRGQHPIGYGGLRGKYKIVQPVMNAGNATVKIGGSQIQYIKSSTVEVPGMLRNRYRWYYSGKGWVQPNYPYGVFHENKSQNLYIHNKSVSSICEYPDTQTQTSSEYTKSLKKHCLNLQVFPFATNGSASCDPQHTTTLKSLTYK